MKSLETSEHAGLRPPVHGMRALVDRLRRDPLGLLARAVQKLLIGPFRYRDGSGYAAERYWRDRLAGYRGSLRGPGHEGLSDADNAAMYREATDLLQRICESRGIDLQTSSVLDVGCGTGAFAYRCRDHGTRRYVGIDVTDVLFPALMQEFPEYTFVQADITRSTIEETFDLVLAIDVLEHVVDESLFGSALAGLCRAVADGGTLLIALPMLAGSPKPFFYLRFWALDQIVSRLAGFDAESPIPWRDGWLIVARRASSGGR